MATNKAFHILEPVNEITHNARQIVAEHSGPHEDTVFSFGKKEWALSFGDPFMEAGDFKSLHLVSLSDQVFGLIQTYENGRTGQSTSILAVLDWEGREVWRKPIPGRDVLNMAISEHKLAMVNSAPIDDPRRKAPAYTGTCLEIYDLLSGKLLLTHEIRLPAEFRPNDRVQAFIRQSDTFPYQVRLIGQNGVAFLEAQLNEFGQQMQKDLGIWKVRLAELMELR